jgi:hypothetical protein
LSWNFCFPESTSETNKKQVVGISAPKQGAFSLVSQKEKFKPESFETKLSEFKAK